MASIQHLLIAYSWCPDSIISPDLNFFPPHHRWFFSEQFVVIWLWLVAKQGYWWSDRGLWISMVQHLGWCAELCASMVNVFKNKISNILKNKGIILETHNCRNWSLEQSAKGWRNSTGQAALWREMDRLHCRPGLFPKPDLKCHLFFPPQMLPDPHFLHKIQPPSPLILETKCSFLCLVHF